jgi:hydrogenase maturation protease
MILVAGIGNIFLGDDGFGSEVARRARHLLAADNVRVVDFGIRGLDLAYALLDGYEAVILIDAVPKGERPGTIYVIEPDLNGPNDSAAIEAHGMDPVRVLALARSMGAELKNVRIVGCEPESFGDGEDGRMGLSEPVEAAVDEAIGLIRGLIFDHKDTKDTKALGETA